MKQTPAKVNTSCPYCKWPIGHFKASDRLPVDGDCAICERCEMPGLISDGSLRRATKAEMKMFHNDYRFQNVLVNIVLANRNATRH